MRRAIVGVCIVGTVLCGTVGSAAQSKPRLSFEVASVRVSSPDTGPRNLHRTTGTRVDRITTLGALLREAFRQPSLYRIAAPDWVDAVIVEIQATMPPGATIQQVPDMLQTLLEERFGLVSHREARPTDAYELVVAAGGMKMKEVEPLDELDKGSPRSDIRTSTAPGVRERHARRTGSCVPGAGRRLHEDDVADVIRTEDDS